MSEDDKNASPFDFDFDALNAEEPQTNSGSAAGTSGFDLENPFGDDMIRSGSTITPSESEMSDSAGTVSADNPFLSDALDSEPAGGDDSGADDSGGADSADAEQPEKKKRGFFGRSAGTKTKKEKPKKEKIVKTKEKKEDVPKERLPRDWGTVLCIVFSVLLLVSLVTFNLAAFLSRESGSSIMQTLCFLSAFNLVGLAAAAVPILFYKFPRERTLPNVMLGVAAVAMFVGVQILVTEFYSYLFILKP